MVVVVTSLRLDHQGIARLLKSAEVDAALRKLADPIQNNAEGMVDPDIPIEQVSYTTDRAARAVMIAHPSGVALQARDGVLTRAAAMAGVEVRQAP